MTRIRIALLLLPLTTMLAPARADAQWRGPFYPGYPSYRWALPEADVRLKVRPKEAAVYVDGFFAGLVDDFDGAFGRLHVAPGQHEVVVYLEGHRSLRRQLYLSVNRTSTIEGSLEPLAAGAPNEPRPIPSESALADPFGRDRDPRDRDPRDRDPWDRVQRDPRDRDPRDAPRPERPLPPAASTSVSLSIRVQPGGASVLIDGQRWQCPADPDERLVVQVDAGHHTIEVQRDGYQRFVSEIDAQNGQTVPLNISLRRDR